MSDERAPVALVVDDDPVLRSVGNQVLTAFGFQIREAESGEEAIESAREQRPDLVLLDIHLPGRDGFSTCRAMRQELGMLNVPILIATGRIHAETIDRAFEAGATDFVSKPLDWQLLQHRVRFLMRANSAFTDLRTTQDELEKTRELAGIGTWELEPEGGKMLWSDEVRRMLGVSGDREATWPQFFERLGAEDRNALEKACAEARESGRPITIEHSMTDQAGQSRFVQQVIEGVEGIDGIPRLQGRMQDVTERREAQDQVEFLESFDTLTQLPNRQFLRKRLEDLIQRCVQSGDSIAVLCLNLDRFERVNQALGFSTGDQLLQAVASRLSASVRATDFIGRGEPPDVSRLSGDEFTIVLTGRGAAGMARQAARRILSSLKESFELGEHSLRMSASIGVSLFPSDADEADDLMSQANAAMLRAKKEGGAAIRFFEAEADEAARQQFSVETELDVALERGEFILEYQPQVDAESLELVGVEALIRWEHPERGRVPPVEFIPAAEQSGQIGAIGEWVLVEACRQLKEWDQKGLPEIRMGVNVASYQFAKPGLAETVRSILEASQLEPSRLELEMTETALLSDTSEVEEVCRKLHELGVGLSLDDFGTGYSSVSHLVRFNINSLKIDRSFVARIQPDDVASGVTGAVIALAERLGITVVAEGVETQMQVDFLRAEGCQLLQGYLMARPMSPEAFESWLEARR